MDTSLVPVQIARGSRLSGAAVVSRHQGQLRVTVVAKATLGFSPQGEMPVLEPLPVARDDVHQMKNPMRSVHVASDLAPFLERAEVLFWGHAHASPPAERASVRLAVSNDRGVLVDKRLEVVGDRAPGGAIRPFSKMAIVYERALGGLGSRENPVGVGLGADDATMPNVVHADPARANEPAGLAPLAATWPVRKKHLGQHPRRAIDQPIIELPDAFAWAYFQAAPPDQRLDGFEGREWIVLEGLHPKHPMLHMRLPAIRAAARVRTTRGAHAPIAMRADSLFLDGEAEHATLTFRASFAVPSEAALAGLWAEVGLEVRGEAIAWTAGDAPAPGRSPAATTAASSPAGTVAIADTLAGRGQSRAPFAGTVALDDVPAAPRDNPLQGTIAVDDAAPRRDAALPFAAGPGAGAARPQPASNAATPWGAVPKRAPAADHAFAGTIAVEDDAPTAAPPPPPPAVEDPKAAPRPKTRDEVWKPAAPPPDSPPAPPEPPKRVPVPVDPAVKKNVYGKFGKR